MDRDRDDGGNAPNGFEFDLNDETDFNDERGENRRNHNEHKQRETIRAKRKFQRGGRG